MTKGLIPSSKEAWFITIKNTALVVLGTFVLAIGTGLFIIPFDLVTGGVSGIGIILSRLLSPIPFFADITVEIYASFLMWLLFFLGLIFLGRSFAMKTLISTLIYPFALALASKLAGGDVFSGFFNLLSERYAEYGEITRVLATVFGGGLVGTGCALTFLGGGSTGGMDIVVLIICKLSRKLKSSVVIFCLDAITVSIGVFVLGDLVTSLLGIVSALICALLIDKVFIGESSAFIAHVVSDKYEEINKAIIERLDRTSTVIECKGGYSGENKKMLITSFATKQYAEFTAILTSIDKRAFVTVHRAHEINGEGWSYASPSDVEE